MKATHKLTEGKTRRQIINMVFTAMKNIEDCSQGTITSPINLASSKMEDGRILAEALKEDMFLRYNDGWYIVEVDDYCLYVDVTSFAVKEMGNINYKIDDNVN